jgi:hypothetical protein
VRARCFAIVWGRLIACGQVLELEDSLSSKDHYEKRPRVCNLGYLRTPYQRVDGKIAYRCASEPIEDYLKKDGGALRSFHLVNAPALTGYPWIRRTGKEGRG